MLKLERVFEGVASWSALLMSPFVVVPLAHLASPSGTGAPSYAALGSRSVGCLRSERQERIYASTALSLVTGAERASRFAPAVGKRTEFHVPRLTNYSDVQVVGAALNARSW